MGRRKERLSLVDRLLDIKELEAVETLFKKEDKKKEEKKEKEEKKGWWRRVEIYALFVAFGPLVGGIIVLTNFAAIWIVWKMLQSFFAGK